MYYVLCSGKGGVEGAKRSASSIDLLGLSTFVKYGSEVCIHISYIHIHTRYILTFSRDINCTCICPVYRYYLASSLAGTTP